MIFFAVLLTTGEIVRRQLPFPPVPQVQPKVKWLAEHGDDYDTLMVGSSRTVRHIIPAERQTIRYVRAYCEGYGQYLRWKAGGARSPGRWALLRRAAAAELRYRVGRVIARPERWVEDLILASETWGQLR